MYMTVAHHGLKFIEDYMERYSKPFSKGVFSKTAQSIHTMNKNNTKRNMRKATRLRCRFDEVMRLIHLAQTKFKLLQNLRNLNNNSKNRSLEHLYDFAKIYLKIFTTILSLKESPEKDCMEFSRIMKLANMKELDTYHEALLTETGKIRAIHTRVLDHAEVEKVINYFVTLTTFEELQKLQIPRSGGSRSTRKSRIHRV